MDTSAVVTPPSVGRPLRLAPFCGVRLSARRVGDPASGRLFARPYRGVPGRLAQWAERGQLSRDTRPALYLHEYTTQGITIRGLVGALDLSRRADGALDRAVLPHEGIHPVQADALADRMTALDLNVGPILLVHRASPALAALVDEVVQSAPLDDFTDSVGQRHRLWSIWETALLGRVDGLLADCTALIADGHHRYAAYLRMQRRDPGTPADRGLAMLVDQSVTPMYLGPIHRVLGGVSFDDIAAAADTIGARFEHSTRQAAVHSLDHTTLALCDHRHWATLELDVSPDRAAVEVLHEDLLPALPRGPSRIDYHHTVDGALERARRGVEVAFLMPAPDVDLVSRIAADNRLLPEKATSFQPKPSSGVLIRSLHDERATS